MPGMYAYAVESARVIGLLAGIKVYDGIGAGLTVVGVDVVEVSDVASFHGTGS